MQSKLLSSRIETFIKPSIFEEFTALATSKNSLNMAQGFPDWEPPRFLKDSLIEVANENEDQYCRSFGHVPLVKKIA
jgi:aspartate/methionine/tyrosine aminotransferase